MNNANLNPRAPVPCDLVVMVWYCVCSMGISNLALVLTSECCVRQRVADVHGFWFHRILLMARVCFSLCTDIVSSSSLTVPLIHVIDHR